ncbi:autoinducer binding domain-containing protein [Chromobacterium haemolyticum]|uniref:autoinducer binding domain-containing protein n=1 Tax=Chromobacterium haemolyticum TaxID=394935 RepID=UPI001315D467|nr:autoinducer binding domain-containing protein [Chromobacterium haemolyticum]BBH11744.1 hypothetical protein CH06BL_09920 [Chromobacterium haemolyticum]
MQEFITRLPEVTRLLTTKTAVSVYQTTAFQSMLLKARSREDIEAALAVISAVAEAPAILVGFCGDDDLQSAMVVNRGWPEAWLLRYAEYKYHLIDPVALAPAGEPIIWSQWLNPPTPTRTVQSYIEDCRRFKMTHGLTFINKIGDCRIFMSLIGQQVEDCPVLRETLSMVLPELSHVAYRVFASERLLAKMTNNQRSIIHCIIKHGLTQKEIASHLSMPLSTVRYSLDQLKIEFGCATMEQLMYRIGNGEM